ncbi:hypothetical protein LIER_12878 [Lithospermum erythrorhizon]|uniref:Integrase catalytic domain-containing protein n=1 Tax=Lithospermum erythrorhizon TaxID=34254 RepID=A0AAV3PVU7_LITER
MNEELRRDSVKSSTTLSNNNETLMYEGKKFSKKKTKQFKPKAKDQAEGKVKKAENNVAIVDQQSDLIVVAGGLDVCYAAGEEDWIVDSGASFHVTPNKDFFHTYEEGNFGIVKMGNTGTSTIKVIRSVFVKTGNGKLIKLKDVRHILDFRMSLLFSGKLDDEGYHNIFGNGQWRLQKGSIIVAEGIKDGTLYKAKLKVQKCEINAVEADVDVWHNRLGHMSAKGLGILSQNKSLPVFNDLKLKDCTHCLMGKQHRIKFNKSSQRKVVILELMYSDVCGPMKVKTMGVERETGEVLKCIRTDNGGEYIGEFDRYCKSKGIRHEQSVPKIPQDNGVAERMNRTIIEKIRCMLSHASVPRHFWGEALVAAVQIINLSPSTTLNGSIPEKTWSGKDVSYKHLRTFGCIAYAHVPKDERTKLDFKSKKCVPELW